MKTLAVLLNLAFVFTLSACAGGSGSPSLDAGTELGSSTGEAPVTYPGGDCYSMDANSCAAFKMTNQQRVANGLSAIAYCQRCFEMAIEHSRFMHDNDIFDHQRPNETFVQRVSRFGLSKGAGENIAWGKVGAPVVDMWMGSPGHRANILSTNYKSFAIATYGLYTTQVFYSGTDK